MAGIEAIDQAVLDFRSPDIFARDAYQGRSMGYSGKICIHPSQVRLAKTLFSPTQDEIAHARRVLSAAAEGVAVVDGQMIDQVHARRAAAVLESVGEAADPRYRPRDGGETDDQ
jgi:citrate lyase subunit beta/citryl-CoA lyase